MLSRHHVSLFTRGAFALCSLWSDAPSRLFSYLPQEGAGRGACEACCYGNNTGHLSGASPRHRGFTAVPPARGAQARTHMQTAGHGGGWARLLHLPSEFHTRQRSDGRAGSRSLWADSRHSQDGSLPGRWASVSHRHRRGGWAGDGPRHTCPQAAGPVGEQAERGPAETSTGPWAL